MNLVSTAPYRSKKGQSLVELCAGLLIAIPVFLLIMNGVALALGYQANEKTCSEAARVAANGDPALSEQRVQSVLLKANAEKGWMVEDLRLVSINNIPNPTGVEQSDGSIPFTSVEVSTAVDIKPFFFTLGSTQSYYFNF